MQRVSYVSILLLMLAGCGRLTNPSSSLSEPQAEEVMIVNGFQDGATVAVGESGLRIGKGYYDFSGYDSLRISFVARRSEPGPEAVRVGVKVGPVTY